MFDLRIVDKPHLNPFKCLRCGADGSSPREYFLDTGIELEWDGRVFWCNTCCNDLCAIIPGLITRREMDDAVSRFVHQIDRAAEINQKAAQVREDLLFMSDVLKGIANGTGTIVKPVTGDATEPDPEPTVHEFDIVTTIVEPDRIDPPIVVTDSSVNPLITIRAPEFRI